MSIKRDEEGFIIVAENIPMQLNGIDFISEEIKIETEVKKDG